MTSSRRLPYALGAAGAAVTVPFVYAALRLAQRWRAPDPDPALSQPSLAIAMFLRLEVAAYVAAMVAIGVYALTRRSPTVALRVVEGALIASAVALVAQAAWAP